MVGSGGGVGAFDEDFTQGEVAPAGAAVTAFAGALVVTRTQAGPGGTMATGSEHADVGAEFDEDRAGTVDSGDGHPQMDPVAELSKSVRETPVVVGEARVGVVERP